MRKVADVRALVRDIKDGLGAKILISNIKITLDTERGIWHNDHVSKLRH